jgi:hypothetical protein
MVWAGTLHVLAYGAANFNEPNAPRHWREPATSAKPNVPRWCAAKTFCHTCSDQWPATSRSFSILQHALLCSMGSFTRPALQHARSFFGSYPLTHAPGFDGCLGYGGCSRPARAEAAWPVRRATTYDWEMTPSHGVQNFTNLAFGGSLDAIDWAYGNYSIPGLWDFNGAEGGCQPNKSIVIGEPYCGGATGLAPTWKVGVQWVVDQIKERKSVAGLSLGDEPEIQGVPYAQMCELSTFLKATLIAAKREDVFIHYNDGPGSGNLKGNGMCKGLDYFSIDSYRDDPAAEVAASKAAYASLIPKLRSPNPYEPKVRESSSLARVGDCNSMPSLRSHDWSCSFYTCAGARGVGGAWNILVS